MILILFPIAPKKWIYIPPQKIGAEKEPDIRIKVLAHNAHMPLRYRYVETASNLHRKGKIR